jgi:hypothetical protein
VHQPPPSASSNQPKPKPIRVIYTGKIDLPIQFEQSIWVMDHKTTSMLGGTFWDRMRMSAQQKGYCWSFWKLTGVKPEGYIINAIRTKQPPLYVTKGTESNRGKKQSPEDWWKETFAREKYYLKPTDLAEWHNNAVSLFEEFFWNYYRGYLPMETANACTAWGRCPYFDVCTMEEDSRLLMLNSGQYAQNEWSPLKQPSQSKQ